MLDASYRQELEAEIQRRQREADQRAAEIQAEWRIRIERMLREGIHTEEHLKRFLSYAIQIRSEGGDQIGIRIPENAICPGHAAPFDYLRDSILHPGRWDKVIWANRSGGKTLLGGIATWLQGITCAGLQQRILGGSLEQSEKMYQYTDDFWGDEDSYFRSSYLMKAPTTRQTLLTNRSQYSILAASQKSVRGPHVPILRLDEIDEMDQQIYQAALYIPQSKSGYRACTELFSTMHKPYGVMQNVIEEAGDKGYRLYKWCLFETLERCTLPTEACRICELAEDCVTEQFPEGKARHSDGYIPIHDAIKLKEKVSADSWQAEALCKKPQRSGLVYREFDPDIHVIESFNPPLTWPRWIAQDYGVENPAVTLFITQTPQEEYIVYDEIYVTGWITEDMAEEGKRRQDQRREQYVWGVGDPANPDQRRVISRHWTPVFACWNNDIEFGIERVKRLLKVHPRRKTPSLLVMGHCKWTLWEFDRYHRDEKTLRPVDKFNHAMAALRYFAVQKELGGASDEPR